MGEGHVVGLEISNRKERHLKVNRLVIARMNHGLHLQVIYI
jgi:hypothetical protein